MNSTKTILIAALCTLAICCNKKFDAPPAYTAPDLQPTLTIGQ